MRRAGDKEKLLSRGRAACTIIAGNYVAYARVLARSFRAHHPGAPMFVLVVDAVPEPPAGEAEPFTIIRLDELPLDDPTSLCFKYSVLELCTALKPFLLQHIFDRFDVGRLIYLDPDILVVQSLEPMYERLARHSIALTPHITDPIDDQALPDEATFLRCGIYNLGFIGVSDTPITRRMLAWWQARCREHCVVRLDQGLFVDQKWMDLVPVLFGGADVVTDPGYNVAYWNLHGRTVKRDEGGFTVNGEPLRFFHFSGYDPDLPASVSKHQTRWTVADLGDGEALFTEYRALLLEAGYRDAVQSPYRFDRFDNGAPISPIIRDLYYRLGPDRVRFGDPFETSRPDSFFRWLNAPAADEVPARPYISNLIAQIANYRADVREAYPEFRKRQRREFMDWVLGTGRWQLGLDPRFLEPLEPGPATGVRHTAAAVTEVARSFSHDSCRICPLLALLDRHGVGARTRAMAQRLFRRRPPAAAGPAAAAAPAPAGLDTAGPPAADERPRLARLAGRIVERTLHPCARHHLLANLLARRGDAPVGLSPIPLPGGGAPAAGAPGVNLVGYLSTESGVGEAARLMVRALRAAALPHALLNFELSYHLRRSDRTYTEFSTDNPHAVNLVHVNADQFPVVTEHYGPAFFAGRANIGFWMWELADFPAEWRDRFTGLDEVWAPSAFTAEAIARVAPVPVSRIPIPVVPHDGGGLGRGHFGLPDGTFVVLFVFDFASVFERKNPLALVEAFARAFRPGDDVLLVIKCANAEHDPENAERLRRAAAHPRIRLVEGYLSRAEIAALIGTCDAYASLHRSEGFGLTLAEAMAGGKPVIATRYSGNLDFMDTENSLLVRCGLVEVPAGSGPYPPGAVWAEPDVGHAAELLRWVFEHRDVAAALAARGRDTIREHFCPEAVGAVVAQRLAVVWERRQAPAPRGSRAARAGRILRTLVPPGVRRPVANGLAELFGPVVQRSMAPEIESLRAEVGHRVTAERLATERAALEAQLARTSAALDAHVATLSTAMTALRTGIERRLDLDHASMAAEAAERLRAALVALRTEIAERDLAPLRRDLDRIARQVFAVPYVNPEFAPGPGAAGPGDAFDYVGFEQKFRGPSRLLEERFRFYLPHVEGLAPVVDLGCGRGEFLGVLREAGIDAVGVELHAGQAEEGRRRGLHVVERDLFEYLEAAADESIGCAFSAQVIEHVTFERLHALFALCFRKLRPGGRLIAETVNPHCTAAFKFFWLDPTHVAPLFPEVVHFLAESVGFRDVGIVYPAGEGDPGRAYHECGEYAVVARKPPAPGPHRGEGGAP